MVITLIFPKYRMGLGNDFIKLSLIIIGLTREMVLYIELSLIILGNTLEMDISLF